MANAPHNETRVAPVMMEEPPTCAAMPPNNARNTIEVPESTGMRKASGTMTAVTKGMAAPSVKLPADASAA